MRLGIGPVGGKVGGDAIDLGLDPRQPHFNPRQTIIQLGMEERSWFLD
jgi:hypothetical protein